VVGDVEAAEFGDVVIAGHILILFEFGSRRGAKDAEGLRRPEENSSLRPLRLCVNQKGVRAKSRCGPDSGYIG
jgi:hypothetical protein